MTNYQKQTGSAHIVIIIIIVLAIIGAIGYVVWNNFANQPTTNQQAAETPQAQVSEAPKVATFKSEAIGVTFNYPNDWIKVACDDTYLENPQNTVYLGSNNYGVGIFEGNESSLCGGGTDFPPQIVITRNDTGDEFTGDSTDLTIDGKSAKKYVRVAPEESIHPGLEMTGYIVDMGDDQYVIFGYNRFPGQSGDDRDNSDESLVEFTQLVEESVRFL